MSEFQIYFQLGMDHILDTNGYDHILFVIVLCVLYAISEWRRVLILVTAFTIGHSITLALSTLNLVNFNSSMIEFLIPVTIFLTAAYNISIKDRSIMNRKIQPNYFLALFFGMIHGLGFSNYLKSLLGRDSNITSALLSFNLGLEVGQVIIVAIFLTIGLLIVDIFGLNRRDWRIVISSAVGGIALMLMAETKFW